MKHSYCLQCRYNKDVVEHPACAGCVPCGNCEPTHYKYDTGNLSNIITINLHYNKSKRLNVD